MRLREFAPSGDGGGSGDYFQALASAWYNGTFDSGSLQKGIKSQQDVEQLLQRGIIGSDGVTRKYGIDYNSTFDGVVISSDDYYEHSDYNDQGQEVDSRNGRPWGPNDYMEFGDEELDESLNEFAANDGDSGEDDALHKYARMWWDGDEATQMQIEAALAKMGWEIGEDEGSYNNGGVFVVRAGDINGDSYTSWAAEDLTEQGVAEGAPISGDGGAVDNFRQQMANNTELAYQKGMAEAKKKKKKKSSKSLRGYFFPGYGYYGSGESGEGGGDGGGGESKNRDMAEGADDNRTNGQPQ